MNQACMACGGSGTGARDTITCWNCHGAGTVPDPSPARGSAPAKKRGAKPAKARQQAAAHSKAKQWTAGNYVFFGITYLLSLGYLSDNSELEGWPLYLVPLIPAAIVGSYWKQLFVIALIIGGLYIWGSSQN